MLLYIVGVTKSNPTVEGATVQARIYKEKPVAPSTTDAPAMPSPMMYQMGNTDFSFAISESEIESWSSETGKYADMNNLTFA